MEKQYEIKDLEKVLKKTLKPEETIDTYTAKPLLNPGENYGSIVLGVTVTITDNKTGKKRTLKAIAKMIPRNEMFREIFNVQVTVKKEISMYTTVIPELERFANEFNFPHQLDFFCSYYGSRLSLNETSTIVDGDAILIIEDLKESGYDMGDRLIGLDLETVKVVLNDVALFHALPIAFKLMKPQEFSQDILPLLKLNFDNKMPDNAPGKEVVRKPVYYAIEANPECAKYEASLLQKVDKPPGINHSEDPLNDPFSTMCHMDLWTNNILIKYDNGVPIKSKLIDFQMYCCGSLANDLLFFLFSSVQIPILQKHYDELIQHYQKRFTQVLDFFGCSTQNYTLEQIHAEMKKVSEHEIGHVPFMLQIIMAERGTITDLDNVDPRNILEMEGTEKCKQRLADTILVFADQGWL